MIDKTVTMNYVITIGLLAATFTTIAFLPQAIKTLKTKKARDLSLLTYIILAVGLLLWLVYGLLIGDLPIIMANSISVVLIIAVLIFKIKYDNE